jgi:Type I restriction-modification system methyltransferase subunit
MLDNKKINELLGIDESYKAPQAMLDKMLDKEEREKLFRKFLEHERNIDYEWFMNYFESEHADTKVKKQDFTPMSVSRILARLVDDDSKIYFECAAGTGSILIQTWVKHREQTTPFSYDPRHYWYQVEELSDRALPFLIFNMSIRGMNGLIVHGDSLSRETKDVYFIRNDNDNYLGFSEVIKMPHTDALEKELNIKFPEVD